MYIGVREALATAKRALQAVPSAVRLHETGHVRQDIAREIRLNIRPVLPALHVRHQTRPQVRSGQHSVQSSHRRCVHCHYSRQLRNT